MRFLLKNPMILDAQGNCTQVHILVEKDKIVQISPGAITVPANEVDLTGYTLLPGMIHTHVHLFDCCHGFHEGRLKAWLQAGITCLRDEGILSRADTVDAVQWRDQLKKDCMAPEITVCGRFISAVNGYGGVSPLEVTTPQEAREAVQKQTDEGVDHIKIPLDHGYDPYTQSLSLLPLPVLAAVCDEAHRLGKRVSAHVTAAEQLAVLVEAGIDEAAHTCYDPIPNALLERMVREHIAMTPTLCVYGEISANFGAPFLDFAMDNTKRFVDMGGVIGVGNDFIEEKPLWSPVGMPMMEMELLRLAGLTGKQVLDAATLGGALILGRDDLGRIQEGCTADLIAVKGDPCRIPYLLSQVPFVMKSGIVVKEG